MTTKTLVVDFGPHETTAVLFHPDGCIDSESAVATGDSSSAPPLPELAKTALREGVQVFHTLSAMDTKNCCAFVSVAGGPDPRTRMFVIEGYEPSALALQLLEAHDYVPVTVSARAWHIDQTHDDCSAGAIEGDATKPSIRVELYCVCCPLHIASQRTHALNKIGLSMQEAMPRAVALAMAVTSAEERKAGVVVALVNEARDDRSLTYVEFVEFTAGSLSKLWSMPLCALKAASDASRAMRCIQWIQAIETQLLDDIKSTQRKPLVLCGNDDFEAAELALRGRLDIQLHVRNAGTPLPILIAKGVLHKMS